MAKITKEVIQLAIAQAERGLKVLPPASINEYEKWLKDRKLLHYDNHSKPKKISVKLDFCNGAIPKVQIIASCEQWEEIYHCINEQTFDSIQDLIHPKNKNTRKKEKVKEYAGENLEGFREDLFNYATAANIVNPLCYKNGEYYPKWERKSSRYDLNKHEKNEVANMAAHLYGYLRYLSEIPQKQWRPYVRPFLERYEISTDVIKIGKIKKNISNIALMNRVKVVMSKYWGINFSERFWQTFVVEGPIKLKRVGKLKRINPEEAPFLKELFKEFMD